MMEEDRNATVSKLLVSCRDVSIVSGKQGVLLLE